MDFAFTNPRTGQSRGTPTPRDYFSEIQLDHSQYVHGFGGPEGAMSPDSPAPPGQVQSKKLKPGPISRSELSSNTNAFKLRLENHPAPQKPTPSARLRQEVFKKPHTFAPPPQSLEAVTSGPFPPAPRVPASEDAALKISNKQTAQVVGAHSFGPSPSTSPFLKSEPLVFSDAIHAAGKANAVQRRRSNLNSKSGSLSHSATKSLVAEPIVYSIQPEGSLSRRNMVSTALDDPPRDEPRYRTPTRESIIPATPSSEKSTGEDTSNIHALRRKCELYEVDKKFDCDLIASQRQEIDELSKMNAQMEVKTQNLESKYANKVKEITQKADASLVRLTNIHEQYSQTSSSQIAELKQSLGDFRQEIRNSINAVEPLLVGYNEMKATLRGIAEEHEQQLLDHDNEKIRLQQTNDLLGDQLSDRTGNYTESLEREKELQVSLITLGESHANIAKSLSTLHEQYDQVNAKYTDSKISASAATKQVGELEGVLTGLKIDNARIKSLLADNEQAFSRKLRDLEENAASIRTSLEGAHKELSASKSGEQAAHSQVQALLREKQDILQKNTILERNLDLKTQSLDEAQAGNQTLERQLDSMKRSLEEARTEGNQTMGQLAEKDRATSAQIRELNIALESHRESEYSLTNEVATLNAHISTLRERAKDADEMAIEHRALKKALSVKCADVERVEAENGQLQSQVVQLELTRDTLNEEVKQLHEASCIAREREAVAQKELRELHQSLKNHRDAGEKASINIARIEGEMEQVKIALGEEKDAHRITEKQREISLLNLSKLQAEQKSALDTASVTEKKLRSSMDESQGKVKRFEIERSERENELKRLRRELDTSNSTKAALEALVAEFRDSVQQARSQREKIETQADQLTSLSNQVSSQKTELRLLEQQLADANAHISEYRVDVNAQRAAAESARASAAATEGQLKQKEQDLEAVKIELRSYQFSQIGAASDTAATSLLHNKIAEQEGAIKSLRSQVLDLEKSSETIVGRYKGGKLTNPEKDLVGVITAGIVQEKNRTINNLKGELKRAELKAKLESNETQDPAGWQSFNRTHMTISSSPLSDPGRHAPDYDPPAPDSPAVQLTEGIYQNLQGHEQPVQRNPSQPARPIAKPHQHLTLAPIRLESGNATDDIQEFEEPETPRVAGPTGRKRAIMNTEPTDDEDQEEHEYETKRKTRVKAKKDNKTAGQGNGQSNKTDVPSTSAKGKATKRRKA